MNMNISQSESERGGAGFKFVLSLVVLFLVAHAGYQYVPVAYAAESLRTDMQTAVLQGMALPGKVNPIDNVKERIQKSAYSNDIPTDVVIDVRKAGNVIYARVIYRKQVNLLPFGLYKYVYAFDYTATPTGFLTKQ